MSLQPRCPPFVRFWVDTGNLAAAEAAVFDRLRVDLQVEHGQRRLPELRLPEEVAEKGGGRQERFAGGAIPGRQPVDEAEAADRPPEARRTAAEEEAEHALRQAAASCWVYQASGSWREAREDASFVEQMARGFAGERRAACSS